MSDFTVFCRKRIFCWLTNAKKVITIAWLLSLVFVLCAFIVACVAANKMANSATGLTSTPAAFACIWTCLVLVVLSILGTVIMRRFQSALSIGFFLGVVFVMSNQMLILFAIFAERSQVVGATAGIAVQQAQQAMAVFSFFLWLVYGWFGLVLAIFRNDVVKQENLSAEPEDSVQYEDHGEGGQEGNDHTGGIEIEEYQEEYN